MLIIIDARSSSKVIDRLEELGSVILFNTDGITYDAIRCHPDIFMCLSGCNELIVAKNTPEYLFELFKLHNINFKIGSVGIGSQYPETVPYNCLITDKYLIYNKKHTASEIITFYKDKVCVPVSQGYIRCNCINVMPDAFITSDMSIYSSLKKTDADVLYVSPEGIILPGFNHGFIGGTCGKWDNILFFNGSIGNYSFCDNIRSFCANYGVNICNLSSDYLFDGGGVFFLDV